MTVHAQKKGKRGEVQFCKWLKDNLGIDTERNYNQADGHSADVHTDEFIFEVKRREAEDLPTWWHQVAIAKKRHKNEALIPVVAFRRNRQPWRFAIPAKLIGVDRGYMVVEERVFIEFAKSVMAPKKQKVLRDIYQDLADQFDNLFADDGCTCHLGHPPCSFCIHPGNPANLDEDERAWEYV